MDWSSFVMPINCYKFCQNWSRDMPARGNYISQNWQNLQILWPHSHTLHQWRWNLLWKFHLDQCNVSLLRGKNCILDQIVIFGASLTHAIHQSGQNIWHAGVNPWCILPWHISPLSVHCVIVDAQNHQIWPYFQLQDSVVAATSAAETKLTWVHN